MNLENEIELIKQRNKRVELDKKWETSWTRKICIMILTYIVVIIYSYSIRHYDNIFLSSLIQLLFHSYYHPSSLLYHFVSSKKD